MSENKAVSGNSVGRDLTMRDIYQTIVEQKGDIYQTIVEQKPDFFEPNLDQYKPPKFTSPSITLSLIERIRKQRLLVLGGDFNIDKAALARHLAWCVSNEQSPSDTQLPVKEWYRSSEPQSIDLELQKTEKTTVFLLTQVSPQNIGYDLSRIQSAVREQHYVIVSTDLTFIEIPPSSLEDKSRIESETSESPLAIP
ncbi:MAG: hypothetical protein SAK29_29680 [Scytonema sp. PMC 1069.18]|nr:hypothetical protein [Scytonema sp. PMC 1069.18]MEC4880914.1 hypothetical protein [Scytonema sp. PMC 1070.18]